MHDYNVEQNCRRWRHVQYSSPQNDDVHHHLKTLVSHALLSLFQLRAIGRLYNNHQPRATLGILTASVEEACKLLTVHKWRKV